MRLLKSHVLLRLLNSYIVDSPQPANISYLWNFGSLLAVCLGIQILTGAFLAMHYTPNVDFAFNSVEHIMRDVNNGWIIRYIHANVASFFFMFVYMHVGRGLYYGSYKTPRVLVWSIGVIILILMMAIAFLGYNFSPKWFNIKINIIVYFFFILFNYFIIKFYKEINKNNNKSNKIHKKQENNYNLNELKYNKLNKISYYNQNKNILQRRYSTSCLAFSNNHISHILNKFIKDLNLNPVYIFENLNLENTRKQIFNYTKGLSGIYMIVNKISKDYYIGSASTDKFYSRFSNHVIYFRGSKIVKLAIKKYKLENFAFIVLELFPKIVTKENNKELIDLEDKYLKLLLPNYNILTEAGSSFGYKHTEIDRIKIKNVYSDVRCERICNFNKGKILTKETIEKKIGNSLNSSPLSDETTNKKTKAVTLYNLNGTIYGKYSTIKEASKAIICNEKTIRRALQTEKRIVKKQ